MRPRPAVARSAAAGLVWMRVAMAELPISDVEMDALARPAFDPPGMRAQAQIFDGDAVELAHHRFLDLAPQRPHDPLRKLGAGRILQRILARLGFVHDPRYLAHG